MVRGLRGLRGPEGCASRIPGSIPGQRAKAAGVAHRRPNSPFFFWLQGKTCPPRPGSHTAPGR